jgi:tetratricopeptide (TPR) repeat protein
MILLGKSYHFNQSCRVLNMGRNFLIGSLTIIGILLCIVPAVLAQDQLQAMEEQYNEIGSVTFFQGDVKIYEDGEWKPVQLGQMLFEHLEIRTGATAELEIEWDTGDISVLGSGEQHRVGQLKELFMQSNVREAEGIFSRFLQMFEDNAATDRQAEGGIRRDMAELERKPRPGELYWYVDEPVDIDAAFALYEDGDYRQALRDLLLFTQQQPRSSRHPQALFMIAHCYIELNNIPKARVYLGRLMSIYPGSELGDYANEVLAQL